MSETAAMQHQEASAYVYSLGNSRSGGQVTSDLFHENNQGDWKSFFKHPPSNLKFKRNPSSSKIVVSIPCRPSNSERQQPVKLPPPPPKSATITKKLATKETPEELHLGAVAVPTATNGLQKIHNHSGSTGDSSCSSGSDSTSPTSQISNNEAIEEDHDHEVFAREDELTKPNKEENDRDCFG